MDWWKIVATATAFIGSVFAFYKWGVGRLDKRRESLRDAHDHALREHHARLDRHSARLSKLGDEVKYTREDLHRNYCRIDRLERFEASLDHKLDAVHQRLSGLARDINNMVGTVRAQHDSEIAGLLEKIKDAVEHKEQQK